MKLKYAPSVFVPREAMPLFADSGALGEDILHGQYDEQPTLISLEDFLTEAEQVKRAQRLARQRQRDRANAATEKRF